ncbi:MAG: 5-formyltetrahydrofolate cyclo-ligase [Proteobacteria bacterium]|nr:5-formyltetrahydrofolate cyclo-ligase [Pseudomonadota bacterium]
MTQSAKNTMRSILRQRRQALSANAQATAGNGVTQQVFELPEWQGVQRIAIYHAADGEIDTKAIIQHCHRQEIQVYLPVMGAARSIVFARYCPGEALIQNSFGLFEPPAGAPLCPVANLDIIFLPLVAWDSGGGRLGMGGGYYDRVLAGSTGSLLVGMAHQIQEVEKVPRDSWDIPLNAIVTDTATYHCKK